ncbi:MAG: HNH endonuclease, partial [Proteobacteria bacterium]|nr:HNH endonuclease [Pseudomonadota bacterium]
CIPCPSKTPKKQGVESFTMKNTLKTLSDRELLKQTRLAATDEKRATLALLEHLAEVDERKAYAIDAHPSLFEYIVRELGYSESQASERVNAVRLFRQNPAAKAHLEAGAMTLTTAAMVQRFFTQEKKLNATLAPESRKALIERCTHQPKRAVEILLMGSASAPVKQARMEKIRQSSPELTEIKMQLNHEQTRVLTRARELFPDDSLALLLERALVELIAKKEKQMGKSLDQSEDPDQDPSEDGGENHSLMQNAPSSESLPPGHSGHTKSSSRFIPIFMKREVHLRSGGQCEWRSPRSGRRCPSRSRLEIDHIYPLALGGSTCSENLRHLCSNHNRRAAIEAGLKWRRIAPKTN